MEAAAGGEEGAGTGGGERSSLKPRVLPTCDSKSPREVAHCISRPEIALVSGAAAACLRVGQTMPDSTCRASSRRLSLRHHYQDGGGKRRRQRQNNENKITAAATTTTTASLPQPREYTVVAVAQARYSSSGSSTETQQHQPEQDTVVAVAQNKTQ